MSGDMPFDVMDGLEIGDLSDQTGQEVMEPAQRVGFSIKKAMLDTAESKETGDKLRINLVVDAVIGPSGVDGEGRYANKHRFERVLVWFNPEVYTSEWWKKQARFPLKQLLKALDYDPSNPPKLDDEFLTGLIGREFVADIRRREVKRKGEDGKWVGTGEFTNELANYRKVEGA